MIIDKAVEAKVAYSNVEKQRIAIAKSVGIYIHDGDHAPSNYMFESDLPDYLNDLNAMHQVKLSLSPKDLTIFTCILIQMGVDYNFNFMVATAEQQAKAYLKTIDNWEGESNE